MNIITEEIKPREVQVAALARQQHYQQQRLCGTHCLPIHPEAELPFKFITESLAQNGMLTLCKALRLFEPSSLSV